MVGAGTLMLFVSLLALYKVIKENYTFSPMAGTLLFWSLLLPWIANTSGWIPVSYTHLTLPTNREV